MVPKWSGPDKAHCELAIPLCRPCNVELAEAAVLRLYCSAVIVSGGIAGINGLSEVEAAEPVMSEVSEVVDCEVAEGWTAPTGNCTICVTDGVGHGLVACVWMCGLLTVVGSGV